MPIDHPVITDDSPGLSDPFDELSVSGINFVVHRRADAAWMIRDIQYPTMHTLVWASSGRARYRAADAEIDIRAGDMLFFPAGVMRSGQSDATNPWTFDSIGFTLAPTMDAALTARRLAALPRVITLQSAAGVAAAVHELDRQWHEPAPGSHLRCRGIVSRLLGLFVQTAGRQNDSAPRRPAFEKIVELLRRDAKRMYTVAELADRAGLSPSRFRVLFRQKTGTSVVRFQNGVRIRRAAGLLRSGEHSVTAVAALLGYQDLFYFSRQFKQYTGSPPSAYLTR